ncbi:MAG: hypothetical protein KBA81_00075 [Rhabdochlamydiaceae bacterium]|nr:hypothetical protein [Rhabdochlamydiaceae bacterium]
MNITFIQNPLYVVDFSRYQSDKSSEPSTVQGIAYRSLKLVALLFKAFGEALFITLSYSGASFKQIVLGYYGKEFKFPANGYLVIFKAAFWVLSLGWCVVTTTLRLFIHKAYPQSHEFLSKYSNEINVAHIRTQELSIDVSNVDASVKVDDLLQIYEGINFDNRQVPGYMSSSSRKEGDKTYTKDELRESLAIFIGNVNQRVAFLGTPSAHDTPRLHAFYQQIEDAVRFSIHESNQRIADFKNTHGDGPYKGESLKRYNDLLEDRARIAIDLAIAGKHCGARYMGEAMDVYQIFRGDTAIQGETLEDHLVEVLARKRLTIAKEEIQTNLGASTHSYANYMSNLGQILALPGTKNIIEQLSTSFDRSKFLASFFEKYTVDCIIDTVQDEVKRSQSFREKITDWIMDQVGEWDLEGRQQALQERMGKVQPILGKEVDSGLANDLQLLINLSSHLRENQIKLPSYEHGWDDFVQELLNLKQAKKWINADPARGGHQKVRYRVLSSCSQANLGENLFQLMESVIVNGQVNVSWKEACSQRDKILRISNVLRGTDPSVIERNFGDLGPVILNQIDQEWRVNFLERFELTDDEDPKKSPILVEGLSKELMEWLLVSQGVLLAQEVQ